jgi:hypothetical protein
VSKKTVVVDNEIALRTQLANIDMLAKGMIAAGKSVALTISERTRSLEQNARMWAMLHDIAAQVVWHGLKLSPEDWKDMLTASLKRSRNVPNLENNGFVVLGLHTSNMTISDMSDLMELMSAFGAERGVRFSAQEGST